MIICAIILLTGAVALVRVPMLAYRLACTLGKQLGQLTLAAKFLYSICVLLTLPLTLLCGILVLSVYLMFRDILGGGGPNGLSEVGMIATVLAPLYLLYEYLTSRIHVTKVLKNDG